MMKKAINKIFNVGLRNQEAIDAWAEKTLKSLPSGLKILDAGAGECKYKESCSHLEYVSQDFAQYDGTGNGKGLQTKTWDNTKLDIVSDITAIPVPDQSFDALMCKDTLEHLPDPVAALREFSRILRPGGYLIITAPFCSLTHFAPYHFCTGFNVYFFEHNLKTLGFEIKEMTPNGNYFEYLAQELRRICSVAKEYSTPSWNLAIKLLVFPLLWLLKKLSSKDRGSAELLCYGYFILARKK